MRNTSIIDQIAEGAKPARAKLHIETPDGEVTIGMGCKVNQSGDFVYLELDAETPHRMFQIQPGGSLAIYRNERGLEEAFFPERAKEVAELRQLARKHGFVLAHADGQPVKRTRAPKGQGSRPAPKPKFSAGQKFTNFKDGVTYTVTKADKKKVFLKAEDGSTKEDVNGGLFWSRWRMAD